MTVARRLRRSTPAAPTACARTPFDPRDLATFWPLLRGPRFDLVILPADNRWSWLARAIGARWITGIAGDRPAHKNWPVDRACSVLGSADGVRRDGCLARGAARRRGPMRPADWPAPADAGRAAGRRRLCGPARRCQHVAQAVGAGALARAGRMARSCAASSPCGRVGPGEAALLDAIDGPARHPRFAGTLALEELWHVLARARLLVAPDTGVAHLGRDRRRADRGAVRARLRGDLRRGRVLREMPVPCGNGRSVPVPRPDDPVLSRRAVGAAVRANARCATGLLRTAAVHGSDRACGGHRCHRFAAGGRTNDQLRSSAVSGKDSDPRRCTS